MEKILKKILMKYFVFKLQEDWKDELKKIPEDRLKKWMDEDLFIKMNQNAENLVDQFITDTGSTWDNEIWMDINDFVNDYNEELENIQEKEEEYWDTDDDDYESKEIVLMHCQEMDTECNCDHADIHPFGIGCNTGCQYTEHTACVRYNEERTELNDDVPDEIVETGGI